MKVADLWVGARIRLGKGDTSAHEEKERVVRPGLKAKDEVG